MASSEIILPENVIPLEARLPHDVLPTGKFLSTLPGIDLEYGRFVGEGMVGWNGISQLNGEQVKIRVSHIHEDTTFQVEGDNWAEIWEMEEGRYCNVLDFSLKVARIAGTHLNPTSAITVRDSFYARLDFCGKSEGEFSTHNCSECHILTPAHQERLAVKKEEARISHEELKKEYPNVLFEHVHPWTFDRPSELPVRTGSGVKHERSKVTGFSSPQEAIDALIQLRDLISAATPLISTQSAPMPSSTGLFSGRYFPSSDI